MRIRTVLFAALFLVTAAAAAQRALAIDPDEDAIRATLQRYFDGRARRDERLLASAFHPSARMLFLADTGYTIRAIPEWAKAVGASTPDPKAPKGADRIAMVERRGRAAIARLETELPQQTIVDYMTLLKVNGEWLIVNKAFDRLGK